MSEAPKKRTTILDLQVMKSRGEKIAVLTAYDYPFARIMDQAGIDVVLVGDSVGSVVAGYDNTLPVTMDEMTYHTRAVARSVTQALVVADTIRAIVAMDVPVVAHIGLTPQSIHRMGGFRVQGRQEAQANQLMADARAVAEAGACAVVLEGIPAELAGKISAELTIPTIGIGAGVNCDGQVLVIHDILGLCEKYSPRFVKRYADVSGTIRQGIDDYIREVKDGTFPGPEHSF